MAARQHFNRDVAIELGVSGAVDLAHASCADGTENPLAGSVYGSGAATQQNSGQMILALNAGDVVTLGNQVSLGNGNINGAVTLDSTIGGINSTVNASIIIRKLN